MVKVITFAGPADNGKTSNLNLFLDSLLASSKITNILESIDYCGVPISKIGTKNVNPDGRYCFELDNKQYGGRVILFVTTQGDNKHSWELNKDFYYDTIAKYKISTMDDLVIWFCACRTRGDSFNANDILDAEIFNYYRDYFSEPKKNNSHISFTNLCNKRYVDFFNVLIDEIVGGRI